MSLYNKSERVTAYEHIVHCFILFYLLLFFLTNNMLISSFALQVYFSTGFMTYYWLTSNNVAIINSFLQQKPFDSLSILVPQAVK